MLVLYALGPVILMVTRLALPAWSWSLLTVLTLVLLLTALASLAYQYTHPTTPLARAQLTWVGLALAIAVGAAVLRGFAAAFLPNGIPAGLDTILASTWLLFPVSIGLAEMRYRLFDVGGVARTALIWGVLVAILLAAYALVVVVSARLAVALLGPGAGVDPTIAVVAALAAATAVNPVRVRLQRVLERRVYRQRIAREQFLQQAADTLGQPQSPEMLARFLTREAPSTLRLSGGWLALEAPWLARLARSPSGMLPLLSLAPDELLEEVAAVEGPLLLAPAEDLDAYAGVPRAAAENELLAPWYAAGARLIVPLRVEAALGRATILGLWALGPRRDGNVPEREDLAVIQRVAMMAAMQLERLTPRVGDTTGAPAPTVTPDATRSPSLRGPLTPRESEVAQLIARGYTNRAIAEALIISERTAEGHAERIRDKLDVRSRAEIAAWASRSDLEDSTETGTVPA
jgi:DNA-binding NarL/FixJ family response regulator